MQASVKNKEICCTGKVSSLGEIMIQRSFVKGRGQERNNMDYIGNHDKKEEGQGRTKLSDTRGIGIQLRGFALGD